MVDKLQSDFVNVVARIKPNIENENTPDCLQIITDPPAIVIQDRQQNYFLDHVFDQDADQGILYEKAVKHLVDKVMFGYNCTVFAYGQTGSGKTYTMGTDASNRCQNNDRGIIIRAIYDIMNRLNDNIEMDVNVSFYEIYNEKVYDLLHKKGIGGPLKVKGFQICDLTKIPIKNFCEGCTYLQQGGERRHKGETKQNATSSRSHAIFTIYVTIRNENAEFNVKLNLVDLAGFECVKRTGTEGSQFQEGVNINLGLFSIGQVISALSKTTNNNHIPYRESIITTVLKDSLNKTNYITFIACVSSSNLDLFDTMQTLDFAQKAKKVKNKPELNMFIEQNKMPKTPARYLLSSVKKQFPLRSVVPYQTPLKRPAPFTTSTSFITNNHHRPLINLSTPSIHTVRTTRKSSSSVNVKSPYVHCFEPPRAVQTAFSCATVNNTEIVPLCSTFMSELNCDSSIVSVNKSTSSVVSSRLDATVLSPVIRGYLETIHNEAMTKINDAIQEKLDTLSKINLTTAEIVKIRQVLQETLKIQNNSSPNNDLVVDLNESVDPNQYTTFVANLTTPNRSARTNLQKRFESPNKPSNDALFKIPKPLPRKRKLLPKTMLTNTICGAEQEDQPSPAKCRRSVRLLEKDLKILYDNSMLNQQIDLTDRSIDSSNLIARESPLLHRRKSIRLSMKLEKISSVKKIITSKSKNALPVPAPRIKVVSRSQNNYNRILNILNYGAEKKLMELATIGAKTAKQIFLYRSINGIFNKIGDLSEMPWKGKTYQRFLEGNFIGDEEF